MIIKNNLIRSTGLSVLCMCLGLSACLSMTGCGRKQNDVPNVKISVWADERYYYMMQEELEKFKKLHADEANFEFTISMESEGTCKDTILINPGMAGDIFAFADDQLNDLYSNNILLEITDHTEKIISSSGGPESGAAAAAMKDGKLYAYPFTAGNGYFLYYNKDYITEEDTKSMDSLLAAARKYNKKISMELTSGWYLYSFFKGAGLDVYANEDLSSNFCNWNAKNTKPYNGIDVAEAIFSISCDEGFCALDDAGFVKGIQNGTVIAGVNGPWNSDTVKKVWGDSYAACKLPEFTIAGNQEQMCSFSGYKLMGINARTEYPEYCMEIAEFLTSEENQLKRFELTGECPSDIKAAENEKVQASPAVAALAEQSLYGYTQNVADPFWDAAGRFGVIIAAGNPDNKDLQQLLDETQSLITSKAEN